MNSGSVRVNGGVYINNDGIETFLKNIKDISDSFDNIQKRIKKVKNSLENDFDGITPTIIDYAQTCVDLSDKLKKNADYIHTKSGRIVKIAEDAELKSLAEFDALEAIRQRIAAVLASVGPFSTLSFVSGNFMVNYAISAINNIKENGLDYFSIDSSVDFLESLLPVFTGDGIFEDLLAMDGGSIFKKPIEKLKSSKFGVPIASATVKFIDRLSKWDSNQSILKNLGNVIIPTGNEFLSTLMLSDLYNINPFSVTGMIDGVKSVATGIKNHSFVTDFKNTASNAANYFSNGFKNAFSSTVTKSNAAIAIATSTVDFYYNAYDNMSEYDEYGDRVIATLYDNAKDVPVIGLIPSLVETLTPWDDKAVLVDAANAKLIGGASITEELNKLDEGLTKVWDFIGLDKLACIGM